MTRHEALKILNEFPIDARIPGAFKMIEAIGVASEVLREKEKNPQELQNKLDRIWAYANNAHYFGDMKERNFYNLIHEVANTINPGYDGDTFGRHYIDEEIRRELRGDDLIDDIQL